MATHFPVSILLIALTSIASSSSAITITKTPLNFIKSSCSKTEYPSVCIQSLSNFTNTIQTSPRRMALTAMAVSLSRARSAKRTIIRESKSKELTKIEYQIMQVCNDTIHSCVDNIRGSIAEFWKMGEVQSFLSDALTDEETCMEAFIEDGVEGSLKTAVEGRMTEVEQVTSNALALVCGLPDGFCS